MKVLPTAAMCRFFSGGHGAQDVLGHARHDTPPDGGVPPPRRALLGQPLLNATVSVNGTIHVTSWSEPAAPRAGQLEGCSYEASRVGPLPLEPTLPRRREPPGR